MIIFKNKKIIVTGGLGFIGSHIVEKLYQDNQVIIIDNESTGTHHNIEHLDLEQISVIFGDINTINLPEIFDGADYILHQAALPSVPRSIKDPLASNDANIDGTLKVLLAARDTNIKKVVFASSSSVYGDTPQLPKVETMPLNPKSPYATTKATGEMYCQNFTDIYHLKTVCLRYFNVFGPRQNPDSQYAAVIPKFIKSVLEDGAPVIFGDGSQSRDFTYIDNVVEANILACETKMQGVYNVACGRSINLNQLIGIIQEILDKEIEPVYTNPRPGDVKHSLADIKKIEEYGYQPHIDFKKELEKVIISFNHD